MCSGIPCVRPDPRFPINDTLPGVVVPWWDNGLPYQFAGVVHPRGALELELRSERELGLPDPPRDLAGGPRVRCPFCGAIGAYYGPAAPYSYVEGQGRVRLTPHPCALVDAWVREEDYAFVSA